MPNVNNHYIYSLADPRNDIVRYVGQGVGKRWKWCLWDKCEDQYGVKPWILWLRKQGKLPNIVIAFKHLTLEQANSLEAELVEFIGRSTFGRGISLPHGAGYAPLAFLATVV